MLGKRVLRSVDDPQVFLAPAFDSGLDEPSPTPRNEWERLDDHSLPAVCSELIPPLDARMLTRGVSDIDYQVRRGEQHLAIRLADRSQGLHVPDVVLVGVNRALGRQDVERRKSKIIQ